MTHTPRHANRRRRFAWLIAGALLFTTVDWVVTWLLIDETAEGTREVAGLSEGNLRALQNPGTLLLLLALRAAWRRHGSRLAELGTAAFILTALGLGLVALGNVVEFGLWGDGPLDSQDPGAAIFFTGLLFMTLGLVLLAAAATRAVWQHARRGPVRTSQDMPE